MDSPIEDLIKNAENFSEDNLKEAAEALLNHYQTKINSLARYAYNINANEQFSTLPYGAFKEMARVQLEKALNSYFIINEHWRANRNLNSYILTVLNRLAEYVRSDVSATKKIPVPVCPICREFGIKKFLYYQDKLLKCDNCSSEIDRLEQELKNNNKVYESRLHLHKLFVLHSRKGYRCECSRFIPASLANNDIIACPYDDCGFFGNCNELQLMNHPSGLSERININLQQTIGDEKDSATIGDLIPNKDISAEDFIGVKQQYEKEYKILKSVIEAQIASVKRNNVPSRAILKLLMYQAFENMIDSRPDDMVPYLVRRQITDDPIQAPIFQEYIRLIENNLPLTINKNGRDIEVFSLSDPNLALFLGVSTFEATTDSKLIIPNNTSEIYVGGREFKDFGPCFMGLLIDIEDKKTGRSLKDDVLYYTFNEIQMKHGSVEPETLVSVQHYRIASHYELGHLVLLQRLRRKLVDSIYFRLHGKKREIKKSQIKED